MNKDEVISRILSDENSFDAKSAEELEAMIDKELSKPDNEIDYELVNELTLQALEERGQKPLHNDVDEKLKELKAMQNEEKKHFHLPKWSVGLVAACVMIMCANVISVSAWNMNIFSLIVELTQGGAKIDFDEQDEEIVLPISEDDPYGIIAKCKEHEIVADTPHYLPEGFILTNVEYNNADEYKCILFRYDNSSQFITISIDSYIENMQMGIPSDKHNISEIVVNDHTAVMSKEDDQMIVIFRSGDYMVNIFTQNVDYSECDKIINSIR
ncbi:MAG: DUF4367 domain-containing protein [Huintestinicola sp.]